MPMYGQYEVEPASVLVNFRVGQPSPEGLLPLDIVRQATAAKLEENDVQYLQVSPGFVFDNVVVVFGLVRFVA